MVAVTVYSAPDDGRKVCAVYYSMANLPWNSTVLTDLEHIYRIYSILTHDKYQWLLLHFIMLLIMEAKGSETCRAYLYLLTLRLLMSYIYGAPSKARNSNVVYIWTYVWQR